MSNIITRKPAKQYKFSKLGHSAQVRKCKELHQKKENWDPQSKLTLRACEMARDRIVKQTFNQTNYQSTRQSGDPSRYLPKTKNTTAWRTKENQVQRVAHHKANWSTQLAKPKDQTGALSSSKINLPIY